MVYTERTEKYISPSSSSQQNNKNNESASSSSATSKYSIKSSEAKYSSKSQTEEKWKYNRMVRDNRDGFNHLHHC